MKIGRLALLLVFTCLPAAAQAQAPAVPQGSPQEQALDLIVTEANKMGSKGDHAGQIKLLETALQKVQNSSELRPKEVDLMRHLARAYSETKRYPDAVHLYQIAMEKLKPECGPTNPTERCAATAYDMGVAQMYQGDFAGAAITLRPAVSIYAAVGKRATTPGIRMANLKLQANVQSMLAAALFRSGKKAESITAYQLAIDEYTRVVNSPDSGEGLAMLANQSRQDAQTSLDLIKKQ